jgi:UDP-N-acetyl-D-mannosaminuronic acid transferase (WecB/TagA/CpsF family)
MLLTSLILSCDEITSVDCQSWISVHGYVVIDWKRTHVLLTLERVIEGGTTDNLTVVIVNAARAYGALTEQKIREMLITFGADGVSTFQGAKFGVTV